LLPDNYIEALKNCSDIVTSNQFTTEFLREFNKHPNREKLVESVMMEMYDRNNICYIVRVIAGVHREEPQEI
jgi:hypothetical protein